MITPSTEKKALTTSESQKKSLQPLAHDNEGYRHHQSLTSSHCFHSHKKKTPPKSKLSRQHSVTSERDKATARQASVVCSATLNYISHPNKIKTNADRTPPRVSLKLVWLVFSFLLLILYPFFSPLFASIFSLFSSSVFRRCCLRRSYAQAECNVVQNAPLKKEKGDAGSEKERAKKGDSE